MSVSTRVSFAITAPLLLVLSAAAIQAQDQAPLQAQVQAAKCRPCQAAQESCSVNCLGRADKKAIGPCLIGCDNAAAFCSCDDQATLSAEKAAALFGLNAVLPPASACNSTGSCGPAYGACTNWSGGYPCGDLYCGAAFGCGLCNEWQCESTGPAMRQEIESYRVCFDQHGTPCTEYVRSVSTEGCGC